MEIGCAGRFEFDHLRQVGRALRENARREDSRVQNALFKVDVAKEFIERLRSLGEPVPELPPSA